MENKKTIQDAIDILIDWDKENYEDREVGIYIDHEMKFAVPLAIIALEGYIVPTDENIKAALSWFEEMDTCEIVHRIKESPNYTCTMPDNVIQTIITALQAHSKLSEVVFVDHGEPNGDMTCETKGYYKDDEFYITDQTLSEPCEWCEGKQGKFFDVNWYDYAEHKCGEVRYCPNCGRPVAPKPYRIGK